MVFPGNFWMGATESGLAAGFRYLGWAVQEVDRRDAGIQPGGSLPLRIASRLTWRTTEKARRAALLEACRALKPDLFLTVKGIGVTAELLRQIKETGARTVMYYPDVAFDHLAVSEDSFTEYDLFVTTKTFQLSHLEAKLGKDRVAYVPHGYCSIHSPVFHGIEEMSYRADLLYSGSHSAYKQKWLEETLALMPQQSIDIVGSRWQASASTGPLSRSRIIGSRTGVAYAEAIQAARINIAIHFGPTASGWEDLVSTRTFEIPACRGFMLHIDSQEIREFFTPGEEIDVFSTPEELADKIKFYLARPDLRATMIERAYARAVPVYSYGTVARTIQTLLEQRLNLASATRQGTRTTLLRRGTG